LNAVVAHRHGDLTATVQAGATLSDVNRTLAQHRQWIPLDPPWADRATIGGIVATNDSGPRRHRYGAPRDLIIGIEFARADGRLAKGGGIVVKNVAGYDMPRLLTGSFGSLGAIVTATFKLYPLTTASRTLVVEPSNASDLGTLALKLSASHLTPTALEFATHPIRLIVRFESIESSVAQQADTAAKLIAESGYDARTLSESAEVQYWQSHARLADDERGVLLKVSVLPTDLAETLTTIERLAGKRGYAAVGRAGAGVFLLRIIEDVQLQKRVIDGLRDALPIGRGSAVVIKGSPELRTQVDVWGPIGDGLALMKAVKQQFDPAGILSPGRGPGGL
jgi:glycolate oxidase FAD binding subunit